MDRIDSLQAGRAIAALAVVVHHADQAARGFADYFVPLAYYGYLGVDFFFVLSGFIIAFSAPGKTPAQYSRSRLTRVFVPYLPIGIAMALLYVLLPEVSSNQRDWSWLPTLILLPVGEPALSVAWTLQHEIFFYFWFGLIMFARQIVAGMTLWCAAIIIAAIAGIDVIPLLLVNLEFAMGVLLAHLFQQRRWHSSFWLISIGAFAAWLALGAETQWRFLFGLGLSPIILCAALAENRGKLSISATLRWLGDASYSLYLAHLPAIMIASRLFSGSYWLFGVALVAGTAAGIAYFLFVERPGLAIVRAALRRLQRDPGK